MNVLLLALACAGPAVAAQADCSSPESTMARAERLRQEWKAASSREAIGKYEEAAGCFRGAGRAAEEAEALRRAGEVRFTLGEYAPARDAYAAALTLLRGLGDGAAVSRALSGLTLALIYVGEVDQAAAAAAEAVALADAAGDARLRALAFSSAGMLAYMRGDPTGALENYQRGLPLSRAADDAALTAEILLDIGFVHGDAGDLDEALNFYQQALALWRAAGHRGGEASTLTSMGLAYALVGDWQRALSVLGEQALPLLRELGDRVGEAASYNNIGYIYQTLGEYEPAAENYGRAFGIYEQINLVIGQALTIQYVGAIHELAGRRREALECYEKSLVWSREVKNVLLEADALNRLGTVSYALGRRPEAYAHFQKALAVYRHAGHLRGQATALNNIGYYLDAAGDRRQALEHYAQALPLCRVAGDHAAEASTLYHIARARRGGGDLVGAREAIEAAIKISETLRANVTSHELRASYFASVQQQFDLYIAVLMGLAGRPGGDDLRAAAFEASERARARSLLETLAEARADIRRGVDERLLRREQTLARQLKAKAERRIQLLERKSPGPELSAVERELEALAAEYQRVQGQVRASSPQYAALVRPVPLTLGEIQQKVLDADTLLLEYRLGEERSFVWAVSPEAVKSFELPARAAVEQAARRVYELLGARNLRLKGETDAQRQSRLALAEGQYAEASRGLSEMLLGPVAGELRRKRLVVVADGALQYVPFSALPAPGAGAELTPLIAAHEVVSLPSASVLALMREDLRGRRPAPLSVAVLADPVFDAADERLASARAAGASNGVAAVGPARRGLRDFGGADGDGIARLPFSRREAEAIMASAPAGDGMLALGFRASRATATSPELARYRVVHFATHGLLNSQYPELSGVVLSLFDEAGRRQDGFLQLHEVYNLELAADLVVLSACQTALGKEVRGEGLVGLTRGFMYAGAPRVVASLWKVDDAATAELMGEFYREIFGKNSRPAEALRAAQLHVSKQRRWRSPYYWAAFTLQGEWR